MPKYIHSGKINFPKTVLAFALAIILAFLSGTLYAFLMELCPFIILDFFILALIVACLFGITMGMVNLGAIRNRPVKFLMTIVTIFVAWYTAWAYLIKHDFPKGYLDFDRSITQILRYLDTHSLSIGKFGSDGIPIEGIGMWILASLELIIFLLPIIPVFALIKDYFCESCNKFNDNKKFYIEGQVNEDAILSAEYSGNFNELSKLPRRSELPSILEIKDFTTPIYKMEISHCKNCKKNGVINFDKGNYRLPDKSKTAQFESKKNLLSNTLVDDFSIANFIN